MVKFFDIIIIGAGASGISCAISVLARGKTVAILDHNDEPLKKVKISGGGRCNFTNLNANASHYITKNRYKQNELVEKAIKDFSPQDFFGILKKHNMSFSEKAKGQLFSSKSSQEIIDILMLEAKKANFFYGTTINKIEKKSEAFTISTNKEEFSGTSLVVATGGMSYQNIGASDLGYKIAKQFGIKIIPYKPALVPFNLDNETMKKTIKLKGISTNSEIYYCGKTFKENVLFTHFGISGPAVLQASLYWENGTSITINLLPSLDIKNELKQLRDSSKGKKISNILNQHLPSRLVEFILDDKDCFISEAGNKLIEEISNKINKWEIVPIGTQGFKLAEVTFGGVDVDEIKETFEAKKVDGLYFIGEVLDVTGQLGGYNLQWAWSSGFIAGKYA